jgi:hypothetical protein
MAHLSTRRPAGKDSLAYRPNAANPSAVDTSIPATKCKRRQSVTEPAGVEVAASTWFPHAPAVVTLLEMEGDRE